MPFLIIFVLFPLAEFIVFAQMSMAIGFGFALLTMLMMAVFGGFLINMQGLSVLFSARESLGAREIPAREIFDRMCIVVAGVLLILPGFISDVVGLLFLIPQMRQIILNKLAGSSHFTYAEFHGQNQYQDQYGRDDLNVIDVEYETIEKDDKS